MVAQRGKQKHARREEQQEKEHLEEEAKKQSEKKTVLLCRRQRPKTGFILVAAPRTRSREKKQASEKPTKPELYLRRTFFDSVTILSYVSHIIINLDLLLFLLVQKKERRQS
jgi:hypothetical protein